MASIRNWAFIIHRGGVYFKLYTTQGRLIDSGGYRRGGLLVTHLLYLRSISPTCYMLQLYLHCPAGKTFRFITSRIKIQVFIFNSKS